MILYSFRRCPYAMRARMALKYAGLNPEHREILLRNKPQEMLDASPKGTVPVLILGDGTVLEESLDIALYALEQNDPDGWLNNFTDEDRDFVRINDTIFKQHLDRYKYPNRYENIDVDHEKTSALITLKNLDNYIFKNNKKELLSVLIFPFIRQFSKVDEDWFKEQKFDYLHDWLSQNINNNLFKSIMIKKEPWQQGDKTLFFQDLFS